MRPTSKANAPTSSLRPQPVRRTVIASRRRWRKSGRKYCPRPLPARTEDFFEAGGDSLKAITLVHRARTSPGPGAFSDSDQRGADVRKLCEALREQRTTRYVPLVLLKEGAGLPPVFFIHGVGGNVAGLFPIARGMTYPGAGFRNPGARSGPSGAAARDRRGDGDRIFERDQGAAAGRSLLSVRLLLRRARGLRNGAAAVGFGRRSRPGRPFRHDAQPACLGMACLVCLCAPAIEAGCRQRDRNSHQDLAGGSLESGWPSARQAASPRHANRAEQPTPSCLPEVRAQQRSQGGASALLASARYRPGFYSGELTLFTPKERDPALPSLPAIWRSHARALSIVDTAGGHLTMLSTPNAKSAAASVTRYLPALLTRATP